MGQSAGAGSVHALIASPLAKGLFHQAIAQSGSGMGITYPSLQTSEVNGVFVAGAAGVDGPDGAKGLAGLRALSPEQLSAVLKKPEIRGLRWGPTGGTPVLPNGETAVSLVPVLTGLTADEGSAFGAEYKPIDAAGVHKLLEQRYGAFADRFAPLYPAGDAATASVSARLMARERGIAAMLAWARSRPAGAPPVYGYLWDWPEPGSKPGYDAFHSSELPYVFSTLSLTPERPFTRRDERIATLMTDYWATFTMTGKLDMGPLPAWPSIDSGRIMLLGSGFTPIPALRPEAKAVFDAYSASGERIGLF
jgi:para-nitrobenzyl esterase